MKGATRFSPLFVFIFFFFSSFLCPFSPLTRLQMGCGMSKEPEPKRTLQIGQASWKHVAHGEAGDDLPPGVAPEESPAVED